MLLTQDRRRGEAFADVWERDVRLAVALVSPSLAAEWRAALEATADAWESAYGGEPVCAIESLARLVDQPA